MPFLRRIGSALVFLSLSAASGLAQGINLSWDECGTLGAATKSFACDTDLGANLLVASFDPPPGVDSLVSVAGQIDVVVGTKLPDWWKHGSTACRGTDDIASSADFSGFAKCFDFFAGRVAGGGYNYTVAAGGNPARARIIIEYGMAPEDGDPVTPGVEYYAFQFRILRDHSTGPGACSGCLEPGCIVLNSIDLVSATGPVVSLFEQRDRNWVTWQSATIPDCPQNTPARRTTWGQVRGMYR